MKKLVLLFFVASSLLLSSCGTTKGYVGAKQEKAALATINQGNHQLTPNGWNSKEAALLIQVDSITVGNYYKGFPKHCYILPGNHTIEIRHYQQWNDKQANAAATGGVIGGAIGGMIAGSIAESHNPHKHYLITFNAVAGQKYTIMPVTDLESMQEEFHVINNSTGERVENGFKPLEQR